MSDFQFAAGKEYQISGHQILFLHFLSHQKHVTRAAGQLDAVLSETVIDKTGTVEVVGTGCPVLVDGGFFFGKCQLDDGVDGGAGDGRLVIDRDGVLGDGVYAVVHLGKEGDDRGHHCYAE